MASGNDFHFYRAGKLHFFCPLCRVHQSTNTIKRVKWQHHFQLVVGTLAIVYLFWPVFGLKGLSLYFLFWGAFEFFYRLRKRDALVCRSCGFDPFLYRQDVHKARKALREHWEKRIGEENLFLGKKLRNYKTKEVGDLEGIAATNQAAAKDEKTSGLPPSTTRAP